MLCFFLDAQVPSAYHLICTFFPSFHLLDSFQNQWSYFCSNNFTQHATCCMVTLPSYGHVLSKRRDPWAANSTLHLRLQSFLEQIRQREANCYCIPGSPSMLVRLVCAPFYKEGFIIIQKELTMTSRGYGCFFWVQLTVLRKVREVIESMNQATTPGNFANVTFLGGEGENLTPFLLKLFAVTSNNQEVGGYLESPGVCWSFSCLFPLPSSLRYTGGRSRTNAFDGRGTSREKKKQVWNRFSVMSPLLVVEVFFYSDNFAVCYYYRKTINNTTWESMNY